MSKKVLILGAKGMLGTALSSVFSDYELTLWDIEDIDIADKEMVEQKILSLQPEIIINAAAYTDVDGCEDNEDLAIKVNGIAVGYLASAVNQTKAILIHYSTDYVFDGKNPKGYNESAKPKPINAYGHSKLRGEQELLELANQYYLIRSSWLYGSNGKNFVDTILTKAASSDKLQVVNDQFGKPTYTVDLAQATLGLINHNEPFGIYHITNETPDDGITWYELAKKAVEIKDLDCKIGPCRTEQFPRPARRPEYSMLVNTKLEPLPDWQTSLEKYLE